MGDGCDGDDDAHVQDRGVEEGHSMTDGAEKAVDSTWWMMLEPVGVVRCRVKA